MPILITILVIGAAAGFLATRFMHVRTDVPTTITIGVGGALIGWGLLRFLVSITGWVAAFVGAVIGAMLLIWLWQKYVAK